MHEAPLRATIGGLARSSIAAHLSQLPTWEMRRHALAARLAALPSSEALVEIEQVYSDSSPGAGVAALVLATMVARVDVPVVESEGRALRPTVEPALARLVLSLRGAVDVEQTPLAAAILRRGESAPEHAVWRDGFAMNGFWRLLSSEQGWREHSFWLPSVAPTSVPAFASRFVHLRGSAAWLQTCALLDTPDLNPIMVVRLAAHNPLPPSIAYALAVRDRWILRGDVRRALVQNRSAPPTLVSLLLPTLGATPVRRAAERHARGVVATSAHAVLEARLHTSEGSVHGEETLLH